MDDESESIPLRVCLTLIKAYRPWAEPGYSNRAAGLALALLCREPTMGTSTTRHGGSSILLLMSHESLRPSPFIGVLL